MRKFFVLILLGLLYGSAQAIPADPTPVKVTQPDGTSLTITLHGDEFFHYTTTQDGYTVLKNTAGFYTYANVVGDHLVPSGVVARDAADRSAADRAALAVIPKGLTAKTALQEGKRKLSRRNSAMRRVGAEGAMDYSAFRGLIILINYTDRKFSMNNAGEFYDDMVNTHDFTGYILNNRRVNMIGSVRDYYYDNSNHMFDPVFDVVGPVDVNYRATYPGGTDYADDVFIDALIAVNDEVDFSDYDTDGDGYVDMVFFLVAGFSANYSGNNENYLWPHMYYLFNAPTLDGVNFGLYACSTEMAGWQSYYSDVNGIGTFCHEFGHVLGLPDLYDTDYGGGGGESRDPGEWSIMAGGSGNDFGRTPVGYSLYERYALGFTTPILIDTVGQYELPVLSSSNQGFRLNTANKDEFFLIENRQNFDRNKWDKSLPGHGMLIARVDSSNVRVWEQNTVNCNPGHMYYELLRADYSGRDSGSDPFPGSSGIMEITNFTTPNLQTWDKTFSDFNIVGINENPDYISFSLIREDAILNIIEDFEHMPVTTNVNAKNVKGVYSKWDFSKCAVESPEEGSCDGSRAVAMKSPSMITTSAPLNIIPYAVRYTVYNPTSKTANFRLYYSSDGGETWKEADDALVKVDAHATESGGTNLPTDAPIMIRIKQTSGDSKKSCYLDNIKLFYTDTWGPETIEGDVNGDGEVNIADVNDVIEVIFSGTSKNNNADVNGDGEINITDVNMIIDIIFK